MFSHFQNVNWQHCRATNSSDMGPFVIPNLGEAPVCDSL